MTASGANRRPLGNLLLENNLVTRDELENALHIQQKTGDRLGKTLINLGCVNEKDITAMLAIQIGIPQVASGFYINSGLTDLFPEQIIRQHRAIPLKLSEGILTVAMEDPLNLVAIDDLAFMSGMEIEALLACQTDIDNALQRFYGIPDLEKELQDFELVEKEALQLEQSDDMADGAPIVRLVNSIVVQAVTREASDIHLEPTDSGVRVRFREDGILRERMMLPRKCRNSLVSRFKILSELNIAEKRLPQDGRIKIKFGGREIDLRVSTMPTVYGEKMVIRLLDNASRLCNVEQLGFSPLNKGRLMGILRSSYGLILITGPTGSGKTTTLYALLREIYTSEKNILTLEDPVEYLMEGINQTQVNPGSGFGFSSGLRFMLRQDPDIIMVGEIRDRETALMAVRAASTGHLVLSTLHTNDAPGAIARLVDMGIEPYLVSGSLLGVVAQRLVRRLCLKCLHSHVLPAAAPELALLGVDSGGPLEVFSAGGCQNCGRDGYRGRVALQEVLVVTEAVRKMISQGEPAAALRATARREGMITMAEDGIAKTREGITSIAEVVRVAGSVF